MAGRIGRQANGAARNRQTHAAVRAAVFRASRAVSAGCDRRRGRRHRKSLDFSRHHQQRHSQGEHPADHSPIYTGGRYRHIRRGFGCGAILPFFDDRRPHRSFAAHQAFRAHPANAAGVFHARADGRAGQPAEYGRQRCAKRLHRYPVERGRQPHQRDPPAWRDVHALLADHARGAGSRAAFRLSGPLLGTQAAGDHARNLRPRRRDE